MALPISPAAYNALRRTRITKTLAKVTICIVAVTAVTAVLYATAFNDRPLFPALALLFVILIVSAVWGLRYAFFVSFLAALGFMWVLPPVGQFWLEDPRDVLALAAFLVIGIVTSHLSERARRETLNAKERRAEAVAAQQRFADLLNTVEGIVWEADADTSTFSFVSQKAERILGYPIEQWLREPTFWRDHIHAHDRDWVIASYRRATANDSSRDFEYRMIAADGNVVWLRDRVTVVSEDGRAPRMRGVMVDVTLRKQAEEVAQRSEKELRDVIETMPAMAWTALPDGFIHFTINVGRNIPGFPLRTAEVRVGRLQRTPKTSIDMSKSGVPPWLADNHSRARFVSAVLLMGNIAGFWLVPYHCEMSGETSSSGTEC
jgi:PAS domain S-box-containing protein